MGSRANGSDYFVRLGSGKNKFDVLRWLFHNFEQSVESLLGDHVGLVQDKNLVAIASGGKDCSFAQISGIINAVVTSRIDFNNVEGPAAIARKFHTTGACAAGGVRRSLSAIEAPGQDSGRRCLSTASGAAKEIGVIDAIRCQGMPERIRDLGLPDQLGKRFRSIPSI